MGGWGRRLIVRDVTGYGGLLEISEQGRSVIGTTHYLVTGGTHGRYYGWVTVIEKEKLMMQKREIRMVRVKSFSG